MAPSIKFALSIGIAAGAPLLGERDLTNYEYGHYLKEFGKEAHPDKEATFKANLEFIKQQNANPDKTWYAAVNDFTDWTNDEFRAKRAHGKGAAHSPTANHRVEEARLSAMMVGNVADSVDWRSTSGVVTPVKDQGGCGSCWAFSATETMESALARTTGKPAPILSPQQIVSCAPNPNQCGGTGGCQGSTQELAFNYTMTAGLTTEEDYPYTGETGTCKTSKIKQVAQNAGFVKLPANNYTALVAAVGNIGPIAISVAAGGMGWQTYGGGVYSGNCGYDQDHAVQLVGYGTDSGKEYWIVRNSWASSWGESGYIRIARYGEGKEPCGMDTTPQDGSACAGDTKAQKLCGLCGILSDSSYPTGMKQVAPSPVPPPAPGPSPGPGPAPTPGCADSEDSDYCGYVKSQSYCDLLSPDCLKTCGCCDASPPDYCGGAASVIV